MLSNDLTIRSLTFGMVYSDQTGSLRREVSRGASLPETLEISHQNVTDSASKRPHRRVRVQFKRYLAMSDGVILPITMYNIAMIPVDPLVTTTEVDKVSQSLTDLLSDEATTGLDLKTEIFAEGQQ